VDLRVLLVQVNKGIQVAFQLSKTLLYAVNGRHSPFLVSNETR